MTKLIRDEDKCVDCGYCALFFEYFTDELDLSVYDPDHIKRAMDNIACPSGAVRFLSAK